MEAGGRGAKPRQEQEKANAEEEKYGGDDECRGINQDSKREGIILQGDRTRVKPREAQESFHSFLTLQVI